ncbi:hypothetical protein BCR32DRAFT_293106 [Anaeromyces robustus]|uniref:Uncharacterized protein n=1 Tax=Anaeromyces robustus TaxID=1754192 RepID=A0A1Y1X7J8_9FUNG|nr:hypothetical protein BCR32DRAFT_293106 [Anaeromyces robustus]|eukprot:ORX81733.1 hypothetical protein BCR32DRAFT_293106 [Anaeromyces robustus]
MFIPIIIFLSALPIDATLHYFFIFPSWSPISNELTYLGSPIATRIAFTYMSLLGILYIKYVRGNECVPGAFMVSNEWWAYEVCSLLAGTLGEKSLSIQSIFSSITNYTYNIPLGDGIATIGNGTCHQKIGAYINFTGYCIIGLPLSSYFCFVFKWNLNGIWIGMTTALLSVSILELIKIYHIDWNYEVQ